MTDANGDLVGHAGAYRARHLGGRSVGHQPARRGSELRRTSPTLLATNNGTDNQDGYLQAGGITATMLGSSFLVQNSGTADNLAGLTVGDGGLTIVNHGEDSGHVRSLYGRQVKSERHHRLRR